PPAPVRCCSTFLRHKIPLRYITEYREDRRDCFKPAIIFTLKNGRHVCADPRVQWVKKHMDTIEKRLHTTLTPHSAEKQESCCLKFQRIQINVQDIDAYRKTHSDCSKAGIHFILKNGNRVCADPRVQWVKDHMDEIDQHLLDRLTKPKPHDTERPEPCCFSFKRNTINVQDIHAYKITHSNCSNAGIHFIMKNGHHVCADPKDQWVKEHMDAIDHHHVANLRRSQHLHHKESPGLCCYTFWMSEIPFRVITGYKETHSACQKPGI
ncbi:C-C motif chemokine 3-like, partial [Clarias magur]